MVENLQPKLKIQFLLNSFSPRYPSGGPTFINAAVPLPLIEHHDDRDDLKGPALTSSDNLWEETKQNAGKTTVMGLVERM